MVLKRNFYITFESFKCGCELIGFAFVFLDTKLSKSETFPFFFGIKTEDGSRNFLEFCQFSTRIHDIIISKITI